MLDNHAPYPKRSAVDRSIVVLQHRYSSVAEPTNEVGSARGRFSLVEPEKFDAVVHDDFRSAFLNPNNPNWACWASCWASAKPNPQPQHAPLLEGGVGPVGGGPRPQRDNLVFEPDQIGLFQFDQHLSKLFCGAGRVLSLDQFPIPGSG